MKSVFRELSELHINQCMLPEKLGKGNVYRSK